VNDVDGQRSDHALSLAHVEQIGLNHRRDLRGRRADLPARRMRHGRRPAAPPPARIDGST
jgi:hypothetical protein